MDKEQTKQAILGFAEFFKGITGNQDLKIPSEIAEKYGIETMNYDDAISRQAAIVALDNRMSSLEKVDMQIAMGFAKGIIHELPSVKPQQPKWIPVSERLPEDLKPVNITWVNHEPEPYYHDIKDKNFVATGIHYRGRWYWYSTTCADYLGEYGSNDIDKVDDAVEIVAWMPLPEPYKVEPQESEE